MPDPTDDDDRPDKVADAKPGKLAGFVAVQGITHLVFSPDGKRLLAGGADGKTRVWDAENPDPEPKLAETGQGPITRLACGGDAKRTLVFTLDSAGTGCVWDASKPGPHKPVQGHGRLADGAFDPTGKLLATCGSDGVQVWDLFFVNVRFRLVGHGSAVTAVGWRADGQRLASADANGNVIVWSVSPFRPGLGDPVEVR